LHEISPYNGLIGAAGELFKNIEIFKVELESWSKKQSCRITCAEQKIYQHRFLIHSFKKVMIDPKVSKNT
jgi:hypothetical protein